MRMVWRLPSEMVDEAREPTSKDGGGLQGVAEYPTPSDIGLEWRHAWPHRFSKNSVIPTSRKPLFEWLPDKTDGI
jgi:hypothetical protein